MNKKRLRIGLTGNIGSGKSTVAKIFELLGVPVYYADERAKALMVNQESVREQIIHHFGAAVYDVALSNDDRTEKKEASVTDFTATLKSKYILNREYLAAQVFNQPEKLAILNGIVHPAVAADSLAWHQAQNTDYTLYEAAITFETGGYKVLDGTIIVTAPAAVRLERVMSRDGSSAVQVKARMDRQWAEERKIALADYRITNDGQQLLVPQVTAIHQQLTRRIASASGS